jgi:TRAP-type C4-dicarboxylate transport system substrate-binding protein
MNAIARDQGGCEISTMKRTLALRRNSGTFGAGFFSLASIAAVVLPLSRPALAEPEGSSPKNPRGESLKIGTLAPAESPWGQVFKTWQRAIRERTKLPGDAKNSEGKTFGLDLNFFWNAQQGDEGAMVAKMKSGQLDGAALTAVGLAQIHPPILVLQLPGLFDSWAKLDRARETLRAEFEQGLEKAGFVLPGWGDVGMAHVMSKGFPITSPADLRGKKPYVWREDPIFPSVLQVIGNVTPVPLSVPEVLPNLNTGAVNVVTAPALAAEQLQWASRLDHINAAPVAAAIGALVFTRDKLAALPADLRATLLETGKVAAAALTSRIRNEDAAAFERMKGKMTVTTSSAADAAEWREIWKKARARLGQGTFPKELVERAESLAR